MSIDATRGHLRAGGTMVTGQSARELLAEHDRLRAEVEALRADAARAKATRLTEGEIAALVDRLGKHSVNGRSHKAIREVEAAVLAKIDAARAAQGEQG